MNVELTPVQTRIIDKVEKLLALSANNPSQEEAQVALDMAHQLLEEHNIEMALIEQKSGKPSLDGQRADQHSNGALYKWQASVWESSAKLNFCMYSRVKGLAKGSKYQNRLIGRPENVIMTKHMAEYLQQAIERIAREWAKNRGLNIFASDAIIFREGVADTISTRLSSLRWEREQEARRREQEAAAQGTGTAVTIFGVKTREDDFNNDYVMGWEPGTTARRRAEDQAAAQARKAEHERRMAEDPEYRARQDAIRKRIADQNAEWDKKWEKNRKRRERNGGYSYRERDNAETRRRDSYAFRRGQDAGHDIGLDPQVSRREPNDRRIR